MLTITAATNATPIVITTSVAHGLSTNDIVNIADVLGNAAANGDNWVITVIDATSFSLNDSVGDGEFVAPDTFTAPDDGTTWECIPNINRVYATATGASGSGQFFGSEDGHGYGGGAYVEGFVPVTPGITYTLINGSFFGDNGIGILAAAAVGRIGGKASDSIGTIKYNGGNGGFAPPGFVSGEGHSAGGGGAPGDASGDGEDGESPEAIDSIGQSSGGGSLGGDGCDNNGNDVILATYGDFGGGGGGGDAPEINYFGENPPRIIISWGQGIVIPVFQTNPEIESISSTKPAIITLVDPIHFDNDCTIRVNIIESDDWPALKGAWIGNILSDTEIELVGSDGTVDPGGIVGIVWEIVANTALTITAVDDSSPIRIVTSVPHNLIEDGNTSIYVEGVLNNVDANGVFEYNIIDATTIELLDTETIDEYYTSFDETLPISYPAELEDPKDIVSVTNATPIVIESTAHGLVTNDVVTINDINGPIGEAINGQEYVITKISNDSFSLNGTATVVDGYNNAICESTIDIHVSGLGTEGIP